MNAPGPDPIGVANRRLSRRKVARRSTQVVCYANSLGLGPNIAIAVHDLSEAGARMTVRTAVTAGHELEMNLQGIGHRRAIKLTAKVAWCAPTWMSQSTEATFGLSRSRIIAADLAGLAHQIPSVPIEIRMDLSAVSAARAASSLQPSWDALYLKAYGFVCAAEPQLRRAYLTFPRPHLYEHPIAVMSVPVERRLGDEEVVLHGTVSEPDKESLADLEARLRRLADDPLELVAPIRRALRIAGWPRLIRRMAWWTALNVSGRRRARALGTCAVVPHGTFGHAMTPLTTTLSHGPVEKGGYATVRLTFDPRVFDGPVAARALADVERVLNHQIVAELRYLADLNAA
jgi:hypothetical protein